MGTGIAGAILIDRGEGRSVLSHSEVKTSGRSIDRARAGIASGSNAIESICTTFDTAC